MNKGNVVVHASPTIDVDESTNDDAKIKIPVDDVKNSTKGRFEVVCFMDNFDWQIWETKHNITYTFQVVKVSEKHTLSNIQLCPHNQQPNKKVLGQLLKGIFVDTTGNVLQGKQIQITLNERLSIPWSAKMYPLNMLRGTPRESFQRLPLYCYNVEKKNLGTVTHIKTSYDNKFNTFSWLLVGAFKISLCLIIIFDGAHNKGKYSGIMFLAVGMYGNNQILPITFGVGKNKSWESWIWFLSRLKECIGDMPSLAIISDKANSIKMDIQYVFTNAYH
uniref:MULE transposase domain-containing protein n=1 Tax=Lactuca sativa TaxID=4236 RepID=A0A9R1X7B2_LACSA|nr:hypothetical protein LSAT_V11C700343340 [Lactuca sativa]